MSLEDLSAEDFVHFVDPRLRFCRNLQSYNSQSSRIYQVERDGVLYVLKAAGFIAAKERDALSETLDVPGITHLVEDYCLVKPFSAIFLKEYAEGSLLKRICWSERQLFKSQVMDTVKALHARQFFNLDIHDENFIVSPDHRRITFIDFLLFETNTNSAYRSSDLSMVRNQFP